MSDAPELEFSAPARRTRPRRASAQTTGERRRRLVTWGLSLTIGVLLTNAFVGESGYLASLAAGREEQTLKTDVTELKTDVTGLKTDVTALRSDVSKLVAGMAHVVGLLEGPNRPAHS